MDISRRPDDSGYIFGDQPAPFISEHIIQESEKKAGQVVAERLAQLVSAADRSIQTMNPSAHLQPHTIAPSSLDALKRAVDKDEEFSKIIGNVVKQSLDSPSQQCRQLSDLASCLSLLSHRMKGHNEERVLQNLVGEVNKIVDQFFQATAPLWSTHLDKLEAVIRDGTKEQKSLSPVPSQLHTHQGVPVTDRTFAHIHAEAVIKGSSFEGSADRGILTYLTHFLNHYSASAPEGLVDKLPSIIKMATDAVRLIEAAQMDSVVGGTGFHFRKRFTPRVEAYQKTLTELVDTLKPGERTLIPAGWTGRPSGHSMKIGIERDLEGRLNVFLYNSGSGIADYHASLKEGDHTYFQPYIKAQNVDPKRLLDPEFTQALFELMVVPIHPSSSTSTTFGPHDIYGLIQHGLGAEIVICDGDRAQFTSAQTAGICGWASVLAVLHHVLSPKDYHRLNVDIGFDSLCAYFQTVKENLATDPIQLHLMRHASVHFTQTVLDAHTNGAISLEQLQMIYSTLKELDLVLQAAEGKAHQQKFADELLHFRSVESPIGKSHYVTPWKMINVNDTPASKMAMSPSSPPPEFSFDWIMDPQLIPDGLARLEADVRSSVAGGSMSAVGIQRLDQFFSILAKANSEDLWRSISSDKRAETMVSLANLSELLFDASLQRPMSSRTYIAYAYYVKALMLELGVDPSLKLAVDGVSYSAFLRAVTSTLEGGSVRTDENLYNSDVRILRKRALDIFTRQASEGSHLDIDFSERADAITPIPQNSNYKQWELRFIEELLARDPSIRKKLEERYPFYKEELTTPQWQVALALCDWYGEILPPAFCAMRRQALVASSLLYGKKISSEKGATFQSEIVKRQDETPALKFSRKPTVYASSVRDFKSNKALEEFSKIRECQNSAGYESEADVMLKSLDEWTRGLHLMLTQGDFNAESQHLEQQVTKTMAYFSKHIEAFRDHDKRMLCRLLLCEGNYLEKLFLNNPAFATVVSQFVNRGFQYYIEQESIEPAMFFVELGRTLDTIAGSQHAVLKLPDYRGELTGLLKREKWKPEERTLLYQQLVASYSSHSPDLFTAPDAAHVVAGLLHNRVYPLITAKPTDWLKEEMIRVQDRYREELASWIKGDSGAEVCNAIIQVFDPQALKTDWDRSNYPWCVSSDGVFTLNTQSLQLLKNDQSLTGLPTSILQESRFAQLFSKPNYTAQSIRGREYAFTDERGVATRVQVANADDRFPIVRQQFDGQWYQLTGTWRLNAFSLPGDFRKLCDHSSMWASLDEKVTPHILVKNAQFQTTHKLTTTDLSFPDLTPEQQDQFFQFLVDTDDGPTASIRDEVLRLPYELDEWLNLSGDKAKQLAECVKKAESTHFFSLEEKPKETLPDCFEVELAHTLLDTHKNQRNLPIETISRLVDDKTTWTMVNLKHAPETPLKSVFSEGMLWRDETNNLTELELPSLELSFKMVKDEDGSDWRAESVEHPGYHVAANQLYRGMERIEGAVVLENKAGKRKLVLPYGDVVPKQKGSLNSSIEIRVMNNAVKRALTMDLDAVSKPAPASREQQLYLAHILLGQKKYAHAQALLRASYSHIVPYSNEELDRLTDISVESLRVGDESPHATAVAATAMGLIASSPDHRPSLDVDSQKRAKERMVDFIPAFHGYHMQKSSIPDLVLSQEETIHCLQYLLKMISKEAKTEDFGLIVQITRWLTDLIDPTETSNYVTMPQPLSPPTHKATTGVLSLYRAFNNLNRDSTMITRLGEAFESEFLKFYELALTDPIKLEVYLAGAQNDSKVPMNLVMLLRAVAKGRLQAGKDAFPPTKSQVSSMIYEQKQEEFDKLLAQAQEYDTNHHPQDPVSVMLAGSMPPTHPRLSGAQAIGVRTESFAASVSPPPSRKQVLSPQQLEHAFSTTPNGGLKLSNQEVEQLIEAIGAHDDLPKHIRAYWNLSDHQEDWHLIKPESAKRTQTLLEVAHAEMGKRASLLEQELLVFANTLPAELKDALLFEMEKGGHLRQQVTTRDLILFTARSQHLTLVEKNSMLVEREKELLERCLVFLDARAQQQQVYRALTQFKSLKSLKEGSDAYARVSEQCYRELTRIPAYAANKHPEMLVFEALEAIGLRDWQVADLDRMLNPKLGENKNVILEKVMGSGKTKVYLPLLALNKADGEHLSFIVVDASQYNSVAPAMQVTAGQIFAQVAHTLHFSRDSDTSVGALKKILAECESVRQKQHFFVVTDKSMHSLLLAKEQMWDEYLDGKGDQSDLVERLTIMREILNLFKEKGRATFDEADLLLNCRFEVVYALGDPQPISPEHTGLVADLYQAIAPLISEIVPFTLADYNKRRPELVEAFVTKVVVSQMAGCDVGKVTNYLEGGKEGALYVDTLPDVTRRQLAIARYEFLELLPTVLAKRCGEHFGYSDREGQILAVPYIASGTPSATSEFAFPYALMDYTIQTLQSQGISPSLLRKIIKSMQENSAKERDDDRTLSLEQTQGYKDFQALVGGKVSIPFLNTSDADIDALAKAFVETPPDLYAFAKKFLFPAVMMNVRKLTSTPYTLVNLFKEVQGFTGTPWNSLTYAKSLLTLRDRYSAGKTAGIIWKNSQTVHSLEKSGFEGMMEGIARIHEKDKYNALIDVGAIFNGVDGQVVAEELLKALPPTIKGVLFFKNNRPVVLDRRGIITPFEGQSTSGLYIYYDQWHTTGTDFKIEHKSLLTVDKNTRMRDLEQGYMRDRQAENGPRVEFLLSVEAQNYIKKELELPERGLGTADILRCSQRNQERELEDQIVMATLGMIKETSAQHLRKVFDNPNIAPAAIKSKTDAIHQLIGDDVKDDPYEQLGRYQQSISAEIYFDGIIDQTIERYKSLLNDKELCPVGLTEASLRQELKVCVDLVLLPKTMSTALNGSPNQEIEQQNQQQTQQEQMAMVQKELMSDVQKTERSGTVHWNWSTENSISDKAFFRQISCAELANETLPAFKSVGRAHLPVATSQVPILSIADVLAAEPTLLKFADIFDIEASYNFLPVEGKVSHNGGLEDVYNTPFERQQLRVQNLLLCTDRKTGKTKVRLINQAEEGFFFEQLGKERMSGKNRDMDVTLYELTLKVVQSNSSDIVSGAKDPIDPDTRRQIVQAKFFNGESSYNKEEQKLLMAWIKEKGAERMRQLFETHILKYKDDKQQEYSNSVLQRIFKA